jgi:hypothetical protein
MYASVMTTISQTLQKPSWDFGGVLTGYSDSSVEDQGTQQVDDAMQDIVKTTSDFDPNDQQHSPGNASYRSLFGSSPVIRTSQEPMVNRIEQEVEQADTNNNFISGEPPVSHIQEPSHGEMTGFASNDRSTIGHKNSVQFPVGFSDDEDDDEESHRANFVRGKPRTPTSTKQPPNSKKSPRRSDDDSDAELSPLSKKARTSLFGGVSMGSDTDNDFDDTTSQRHKNSFERGFFGHNDEDDDADDEDFTIEPKGGRPRLSKDTVNQHADSVDNEEQMRSPFLRNGMSGLSLSQDFEEELGTPARPSNTLVLNPFDVATSSRGSPTPSEQSDGPPEKVSVWPLS